MIMMDKIGKFNATQEIENIVAWIRTWFDENGPKASAVLGISGGKDSTIIAALLVKALGKDRVVGVMMPNGIQPDIDDSKKVIEFLGIKGVEVNINNAFNGLISALYPNAPEDFEVPYDVRANIAPRLRMTTLYAVAQGLPNGGRVINTCNGSEDYVGYSTKFGDSAGDMSPCGNYLVSEMLQIGDALGLPRELVHKVPSDGLCGKTDEDNLGFTYDELDTYIRTGVISNDDKKAKIDRMHKLNMHKILPMPVCGRKPKNVLGFVDN